LWWFVEVCDTALGGEVCCDDDDEDDDEDEEFVPEADEGWRRCDAAASRRACKLLLTSDESTLSHIMSSA
jgi:hypothetical protein